MESIKVKALLLGFMFVVLASMQGYGQTFGEFFIQKKTQKKYLLQQIAALEVYAGYLKKGYDLASSGLETVRGFTRGEFDLHHTFISSLKQVRPVIRDNSKVAEIIVMQLEITGAFRGLADHQLLSQSDQQYISAVKDQVIDECRADMDELLLVITSGRVEMGDDERLKRLDKVYLSMQEKSAFTQKYQASVRSLIRQKESEEQAIKNIKEVL